MSNARIAGYALSVKWDVDGMPPYVGPFDTEEEARDFAGRNVPNGSWEVFPLAAPYRQSDD